MIQGRNAQSVSGLGKDPYGVIIDPCDLRWNSVHLVVPGAHPISAAASFETGGHVKAASNSRHDEPGPGLCEPPEPLDDERVLTQLPGMSWTSMDGMTRDGSVRRKDSSAWMSKYRLVRWTDLPSSECMPMLDGNKIRMHRENRVHSDPSSSIDIFLPLLLGDSDRRGNVQGDIGSCPSSFTCGAVFVSTVGRTTTVQDPRDVDGVHPMRVQMGPAHPPTCHTK